MQRNGVSRLYDTLVVGLTLFLAAMYGYYALHGGGAALPVFPFLAGSVAVCVLYLYIYRRGSLFCFETLFFVLYILSAFFTTLVVDNLGPGVTVSNLFSYGFPSDVTNRSMLLQCLSLALFIVGCITENRKGGDRTSKGRDALNYASASRLMSWATFLYVGYLCVDGTIATWFHYVNPTKDYTNTAIVYVTILMLVSTAMEFLRLTKQQYGGMGRMLRAVNKMYLFNLCVLSSLLMVSGNRNECLLILLPPIVAFGVYIRRISNRVFVIGLVAGTFLMVLVGVTRQLGVSVQTFNEQEVSVYEMTRDFACVDVNTQYLIQYTDVHGPILFTNAMTTLFSSVPLLGGVMNEVLGVQNDIRSTEITTMGMQSPDSDSGLGTALVGDLYYTGGVWFTVAFMFLFGKLMGYLTRRYTAGGDKNIWWLMVYLFMFANVVYIIRAEWTMPFRYIGFAFVVTVVFKIVSPNRQTHA